MEIYKQKLNGKEFLLWIPVLGYILTAIATLPLQVAAFILIKPWSLWAYRKVSYYFTLATNWRKWLI